MTKHGDNNNLVPDYPQGHVGHLDPEQEQALVQFRSLIKQQGLRITDEGTLLRFLRARRWNPEHALDQLTRSLNWLSTVDIEGVRSTLDMEQWKQSCSSVPFWTGRRDRRGQPIIFVEAGAIDPTAWSEDGQPQAIRDHVAATKSEDDTLSASMLTTALHIDMLFRVFAPMCSNTKDRLHPDVPVTMATIIADISGLSLRKFWSIKNHVFCLLTSISVLFPETASRIFMICAPASVGIMWNWIKSWLDPVTASKVVILKSREVKDGLTDFIHPSSIPVKYGGTFDGDWASGIALDESLQSVVDWEPGFASLPTGPLSLEKVDDRLVCYTTGSSKGNPRRKKVFTMPNYVQAESSDEDSVELSPMDEKAGVDCTQSLVASAAA
ncbi:hypothetical protein L249_3906 [Ophiocordyceps polyrhachis-furcata BCC 54312]|uniref:CRAL-TRIO domain-containing protein n=1 Tax=Ophiocordyceps polyrhachis-furcata BCC 54312 TaxID=1330021 RepID=A0A367L571_9HYPO|nr:hypothetical protein L249_3906 [Ophiocordyceps polyrhachis-furcata BCC 54312]